MQARFIGDPRNGGDGPDTLPMFGTVFTKGEWTDIDPEHEAAIRGHDHFEMQEARPILKPRTRK